MYKNKYEILILIFSIFTFLITNPGYHWQDYNYIHQRDFLDSFLNYKENAGYHLYFRPFMFLHLRFIDFLNLSEFFYNMFNSLSWIISVFLFYYVFQIKKFTHVWFLLICLFPTISSSIILSGLFLTFAHSFIFFSLAGFFLKRYVDKDKIIDLFLFNIFLIISLLFYEISIIFIPFYFIFIKNKKKFINLVLNLLAVILLYILYNKIFIEIIVQPNVIDTRIRLFDLTLIPIFISNLLVTSRILIIDIPQLFLSSFFKLFYDFNVLSLILPIAFLMFSLFLIKKNLFKITEDNKKFLIIIFFTFLLNIGLLSATNFPPLPYGNFNRGIVGFLFFIGCFLPIFTKNSFIKYMIVLFIFLNFVCFINIRDNHQKIEEFKHQFLKVVKEENEIKKIIIFPIGHKFNTNGEEIYETENDVRSYFYGKSLISFYNRKYDYNILEKNINFLLPTRACNFEEYKKHLQEFNFPIKIFIYNKNLDFISKIISSEKEAIDYSSKNLDCNYSSEINHYYSQSYILTPFCREYFGNINKLKKLYCKNIISSYSNYLYFSSKL
ncbi:hypothetical protein N8729_01915 [Candidatus Pelagibacter sp.]|nr:hypothetical protein [Candidatus Pelagibacter sp.]